MTTQVLRRDVLRPLHRVDIRDIRAVSHRAAETATQIAGLLVLTALGALAVAVRVMIFTPGL